MVFQFSIPGSWKRKSTLRENLLFSSIYIEPCSFPWWLRRLRIHMQCGRHGFSLWGREWLPTAVFLPGEFHGQRSLAGYSSPQGHKELDMTKQLSLAEWVKLDPTTTTKKEKRKSRKRYPNLRRLTSTSLTGRGEEPLWVGWGLERLCEEFEFYLLCIE